MPCFVLCTMPDGRTHFCRNFTDRVPALEYIRKQLGYKSLMASAATYRIFTYESAETFDERNMP